MKRKNFMWGWYAHDCYVVIDKSTCAPLAVFDDHKTASVWAMARGESLVLNSTRIEMVER